jgi:hypothetical protein
LQDRYSSWPGLVSGARRTRWRGSGCENMTGGEGMADGALLAGWGYSDEQSRPRGGGIGCAKASTSSVEGGGRPRDKTHACGWAKSTARHARTAHPRGKAPANMNLLWRGKIRATRAWGKVPHLGTTLGEAWRGVWSSGQTAQRAHFSGKL